MKLTPIILSLLVPLGLFAQIPVTDVATNASVGVVNSQLININVQLKAVNNSLSHLIKLMEKNNNDTSKSRKILKEELEAKKQAPKYVTLSTDVNLTMDLKSKIIEAYRTSKQTVQVLEYLDRKETNDFIGHAVNAILDTKNLYKQCNDILNTKAIILPEERLKKVNDINRQLETILDNLIAYNHKLFQINSLRKARGTLINMNKD
ncbi:hypothetical protein KCTC52924_03531 [Arenibacter antarcticus]|uniref:Conjugal transfer protein TraI n=1 Tax=Arenibacter antarcticus TaxID=2040469 RepID=A0ABW5VI43_9FLAO|nr:hypothetical protein [Arenibacter sp. H213]MCM4166591.1 hypothetical protein [Arenibacter sp. H213]